MADREPIDLEAGLPSVDPPLPAQQQLEPRRRRLAAVPAGRPQQVLLPDRNSMLTVSTLLLAYQLSTSIPGGRWQDSQWDKDGKLLQLAGDPIMRDLDRPRYYLFMVSIWVGFASLMVATLSLLLRMAVDSCHVQWSFAVGCSSVVLTFVLSQPRTHLLLDILIWAVTVAFLWITVSPKREGLVRAIIQVLCCKRQDN